jgi:hypothetical protein
LSKRQSSVNRKTNRERELETKVGIGKRETGNGKWKMGKGNPTCLRRRLREGLADSGELARSGGIVVSVIGNGNTGKSEERVGWFI